MTAWNKLKSMFVVSESSAASASVGSAGSADALATEALSDADAVLKELEKYELPAGEAGTLPPQAAPPALEGGAIDFQALYDQAGIPNTDEVEALERFLKGLDTSLPESAKVAAARAFLGAIGKAAKDVITDAGRKIQVVRAIADAKRVDTEKGVAGHQAAIADLQRQMDEHRASIQGLQKDLEGVRGHCAVEESRLQGARMFFGHMGDAAGS